MIVDNEIKKSEVVEFKSVSTCQASNVARDEKRYELWAKMTQARS